MAVVKPAVKGAVVVQKLDGHQEAVDTNLANAYIGTNAAGEVAVIAFGSDNDSSYAPLASPAFTGSPTAPTKAPLTNNTDIATTAYTDAAVAVVNALVSEIETDLGADVQPASTAVNQTASATVGANEISVFTGVTASQTLTLPTTPAQSTVNTIANYSAVTVTVAPGGSDTINNLTITGSITLGTPNSVQLVYLGTTWYVINKI